MSALLGWELPQCGAHRLTDQGAQARPPRYRSAGCGALYSTDIPDVSYELTGGSAGGGVSRAQAESVGFS